MNNEVTIYEDPHSKIQRRVDQKITERNQNKNQVFTPDLHKVEKNLRFSKKLADRPLKKKIHEKLIFGIPFDPAILIYGNNIWDRSIYVTDELCDMYTSGTLEQQAKYVKKKRKMDNKLLMFILILMGFGGLAFVFLIFLMMMMGG